MHFGADTFVPFLIFAIPIVAIVGGITAGIVRTLGRQRLAELAQQERLAMIQRGIDPAKLPPPSIALDDDDVSAMYLTPHERDRRRAQGLMIGGLITTFAGVGVAVFLLMLHPDGEDHNAWAVGLIPAFVGVALLLSSWLVRPRGGAGGPQGS